MLLLLTRVDGFKRFRKICPLVLVHKTPNTSSERNFRKHVHSPPGDVPARQGGNINSDDHYVPLRVRTLPYGVSSHAGGFLIYCWTAGDHHCSSHTSVCKQQIFKQTNAYRLIGKPYLWVTWVLHPLKIVFVPTYYYVTDTPYNPVS